MVQSTIDTYSRIDILINNAGITIDGFLTKMNETDWEKVIAVNLSGVFKFTKAVVPVMMEQGAGVIINASSVVGLYGNIGQTNYAATKAGVIGLTKSWAKEFGPKGIRVNAIAPGFIETDMTSTVPKKVLDIMKEKTPLRKLGKPEDIASAYLFLASDDANYINGAILSVDGGLVI
jgi:3-oxoacyl-[acyl-carrier protein] reductase